MMSSSKLREAFSKAALANADGLVAWLERVDTAALAAAPRLRAVSRIGVGFDTVDIPACTERGIAVMVVNGTNDLSVAEHAMMLMLGVARRAVDSDAHIKQGGGGRKMGRAWWIWPANRCWWWVMGGSGRALRPMHGPFT